MKIKKIFYLLFEKRIYFSIEANHNKDFIRCVNIYAALVVYRGHFYYLPQMTRMGTDGRQVYARKYAAMKTDP